MTQAPRRTATARAGAADPAARRGASARRPAAVAANRIRIIGGAWKRTPLAVPDVAGLRPTPDRVRETLFNWLGHDLHGLACLDLFAGTGALGLEAASRGAAEVWLVEPERRARLAIEDALGRLDARQVRLLPLQAVSAIARARTGGRVFDVVFLDPPFGQGWLERILPMLPPLLAAGARIYVESDAPMTPGEVERLLGPGFRIARAERAGQVHYHLILRSTPEDE